MDILVRKYVEKKANKWGFSDDIDISKEIIKVENTYSDKIFKVRFNSFRFLGYYGLDAFVRKRKIIFSPEWAARVVLKRNESQIPFLYTLGHEMAHTERDICPLKHPKYCKFIAWRRKMKYIKINENGIHIVFGITDKNQIKLLHFSKAEFDENDICKFGKECKAEDLVRKEQFIDEAFQLVQVNLAGYNRPYEKHGNKHICTAPGYLLTYAGMEDSWNEIGRKITIYQEDKEETHVRVETRMQFYKGTSIVRMVNKVINEGDSTQCLEYLSSFCYTGIEKEGKSNSDAKMRVRIPYNGWQKEMSIKEYKFGDVGLAQTQPGV